MLKLCITQIITGSNYQKRHWSDCMLATKFPHIETDNEPEPILNMWPLTAMTLALEQGDWEFFSACHLIEVETHVNISRIGLKISKAWSRHESMKDRQMEWWTDILMKTICFLTAWLVYKLKRKCTLNVRKFRALVACQKYHRQTGQTQTRLLLKKQSDQGFPCLLFWTQANILLENRNRRVFEIFEHLLYWTYRYRIPQPGINYPEFLVFTCHTEQASIPVPGYRLN